MLQPADLARKEKKMCIVRGIQTGYIQTGCPLTISGYEVVAGLNELSQPHKYIHNKTNIFAVVAASFVPWMLA